MKNSILPEFTNHILIQIITLAVLLCSAREDLTVKDQHTECGKEMEISLFYNQRAFEKKGKHNECIYLILSPRYSTALMHCCYLSPKSPSSLPTTSLSFPQYT